jgi:hypothetical protein
MGGLENVSVPIGGGAPEDLRNEIMSVADFVGLVGVAAYLAAYGLLQLGRLRVEDSRYALLNGIGALAILYSLLFDFNLPSFVTQTAWLFFTIIGFVRSRSKRAPSPAQPSGTSP